MKWVWSAVAVVAIIGLILIANKGDEAVVPESGTGNIEQPKTPAPTTATTTSKVKKPTVKTPVKTPAAEKPLGNVVKYTNNGFEPATLEVKRGESVEFLNQSDKAMVIRSRDDNPENFYPGFSQEGGPLGRGGRFYFAFTIPGTWPYHNLNTITGTKDQGVIIVK